MAIKRGYQAGLTATGRNYLCVCWDMPDTSSTLWLHGNCQGTLNVHHMPGEHQVQIPKAQDCFACLHLVCTQQAMQFGSVPHV